MKKTLCWSAILRNEEKIIRRLLNSIKDHIDSYALNINDSSDKTEEIVKEVLKDIPGEISREPWKSFGYNRNIALQMARNKADYILLLDGDMALTVIDPDFKSKLTADVYHVMQGNKKSRYPNVRIIKGDLDYKYINRTHEAIHC